MSKKQSQSRAQRRAYEKFLKQTNPQGYKDWKSNATERGFKLHQEQVESVRKEHEEFYERKQTNMIIKLRNEGKTNEEIDKHIAIWIKTIKPWSSNEKALSLKDAKKEYELENSTNNDNDTTN